MFSSEIFRQISDGVTLDLKNAGIKWDAASSLRPDAECVINIIFIKTRSFNITQTNAKLAQVIISQFGGPDGELAASQRYLSQRYTMPDGITKGLIMILEQRNLPISKSSARLSIS